MAKIKNIDNINWQQDAEQLGLLCIASSYRSSVGTDTLKGVWLHFIKINTYLPYGSVITHLFIYPKEKKTKLSSKTHACVFTQFVVPKKTISNLNIC